MFATQKQTLDSLIRIRTFVDAHPARGPLTYGTALEKLDDAIEKCRAHAAAQISGRAFARAARRRQAELVARLRTAFMRPIVATARAPLEPDTDVGLPVAFRMPKVSISVVQMLAHCDGMIELARSCEAYLVAQGFPTDFLDRFQQMTAELAATMAERATHRASHMGAGAGLKAELRRARVAVNCLDAVMRVAYADDEAVLAAWRRMKRVHLLPEVAAPEPVVEISERRGGLALVVDRAEPRVGLERLEVAA